MRYGGEISALCDKKCEQINDTLIFIATQHSHRRGMINENEHLVEK